MRPDPPDLPPAPEPADLGETRISEAVVTGAARAGARRAGWSLTDVAFEDCDLANLDARGSSWWRVAVRGGRLTGCALVGATLREVSFVGCSLDLAVLGGAELERVRFEGCSLAQAELGHARMKLVVFEDCDLTGADVRDARFELVEMRGCRLDGLRGASELRGVRMPWNDVLQHAALFSAACGVEVVD